MSSSLRFPRLPRKPWEKRGKASVKTICTIDRDSLLLGAGTVRVSPCLCAPFREHRAQRHGPLTRTQKVSDGTFSRADLFHGLLGGVADGFLLILKKFRQLWNGLLCVRPETAKRPYGHYAD